MNDINGESIFYHMNALMEVTAARCFSVLPLIFGAGFLKCNFRKQDRLFHDRVIQFRKYAKDVIIQELER